MPSRNAELKNSANSSSVSLSVTSFGLNLSDMFLKTEQSVFCLFGRHSTSYEDQWTLPDPNHHKQKRSKSAQPAHLHIHFPDHIHKKSHPTG